MASRASSSVSGTAIVPAPVRSKAKAKPRAQRDRRDDDPLSIHPAVISLVHRDDPSMSHPFDQDLKCSQIPDGKKDRKEFGTILGDIRGEYKDLAKMGAISVSFFRRGMFFVPKFCKHFELPMHSYIIHGGIHIGVVWLQIVFYKLNIFSYVFLLLVNLRERTCYFFAHWLTTG